MTNKPQLHWSSLAMFMRCGIQYERRYVRLEKRPPSPSMIAGTGCHKTAEANLKHKCLNEGSLLKEDVITDIARDAVDATWTSGGVLLLEDEKTKGEKKVKGETIDKGVRLSKVHYEILAPDINPIDEHHVERKWVVELPGEDFNIGGMTDVIEPTRVRDLKNKGKSASQGDANTSDQLTMYAMQFYLEQGRMPEELYLDYTADLKSGAKAATLKTTRSKGDFKVLMNRMASCVRAIHRGVFYPTDQANWWCDIRFCGYAIDCPYYRKV